MKKSLFGSLLGFFLVVGLSLALSANPSDPKKAETAKGCCSGGAKTEQAAGCSSAEKKGCASAENKGCAGDKTEQRASATEKKEGTAAATTNAPARRACCSGRPN